MGWLSKRDARHENNPARRYRIRVLKNGQLAIKRRVLNYPVRRKIISSQHGYPCMIIGCVSMMVCGAVVINVISEKGKFWQTQRKLIRQ